MIALTVLEKNFIRKKNNTEVKTPFNPNINR